MSKMKVSSRILLLFSICILWLSLSSARRTLYPSTTTLPPHCPELSELTDGTVNDTEQFILDITQPCINHEDCQYPYTCHYTTLGRRCIKNLKIPYKNMDEKMMTVEQLRQQFNVTYDLEIPWEQSGVCFDDCDDEWSFM